ncbi:MAG: rare lipoprotein [Thermoleophilaceae bacterium]|nr:rare lipoprotein [Thermoleophilaceae bacterium]
MAVVPSSAQAQSAGAAPASSGPESISVSVKRHALAGQKVKFGGKVGSGSSGRSVLIQQRSGNGWKTVASTKTRGGGRYSAYWRSQSTGRQALRAFVRGGGGNGAAVRSIKGGVTLYRTRFSSYYGPGLYGNKLACGGRLSPSTLGVANKTLPCGTKVTLRYKGRSVTVPVVDRGPYVGGRYYDLTTATKQKLGFGSTGTVWSTK